MEQTQIKRIKKQKTALDEADNEKMKELLISFGAIETDNRNESNATVTGMYVSIACYLIQVYTYLCLEK